MSLINDALRRAKAAQHQSPPTPPSDLQFRPVEPTQNVPRRGHRLLLPAALVMMALPALWFVWAWAQPRAASGPLEVHAKTAPFAQAIPTPPLAPAPMAAADSAPAPATQPKPAPQAASPAPVVTGSAVVLAADAPPAATNAAVADAQDGKVTNAPAVTPPPPSKPAPLRLQAIVFNPSRPSAMVGGKTLFIGDKLGEFWVQAIDQGSLTLVSASRTNVLTLSE